MSRKSINIISYIIATFAIFLIVFACFAPSIFIQSSEKYDFTSTGQIGDTIGGTMSPIVAIAGVFMTFIAFLMQVNANMIQSNQIKKSFSMKQLETKIDSRNAMELLDVDIKVLMKDILATCEELQRFCDATEMQPTGDITLHFTPNASRNRYRTIDRNLLFNAYNLFINSNDKIEVFRQTYTLLDFYSEGLQIIYDNIYKPYTADIMETKNKLPDLFDAVNKEIEVANANANDGARHLLHKYSREMQDDIIKDNVLDAFKLYKTIENGRYLLLFQATGQKFEALRSCVNLLVSKNLMLCKELRKTREEFLKAERYGKLEEITKLLQDAILENSIGKIQEEFENS